MGGRLEVGSPHNGGVKFPGEINGLTTDEQQAHFSLCAARPQQLTSPDSTSPPFKHSMACAIFAAVLTRSVNVVCFGVL